MLLAQSALPAGRGRGKSRTAGARALPAVPGTWTACLTCRLGLVPRPVPADRIAATLQLLVFFFISVFIFDPYVFCENSEANGFPGRCPKKGALRLRKGGRRCRRQRPAVRLRT